MYFTCAEYRSAYWFQEVYFTKEIRAPSTDQTSHHWGSENGIGQVRLLTGYSLLSNVPIYEISTAKCLDWHEECPEARTLT